MALVRQIESDQPMKASPEQIHVRLSLFHKNLYLDKLARALRSAGWDEEHVQFTCLGMNLILYNRCLANVSSGDVAAMLEDEMDMFTGIGSNILFRVKNGPINSNYDYIAALKRWERKIWAQASRS